MDRPAKLRAPAVAFCGAFRQPNESASRARMDYFRTHNPVAVAPGAHLRPSGAPAEHTSDTSCSVSLHVTASGPVTMRMPDAAPA
jgi:hypothetical protein